MASWVSAAWIARVLNEHGAALELFAAQWTDSPEDCVQEAILELTRQSAPPQNVAAWLFHVVRLRAISAKRSSSRRRRHESLAARLVRITTDPRESNFDGHDLAIALNQLDDEQREVIVAKIWGGLGFAEIAQMIGTSTATAFRRYEAGLTVLRTKLESLCDKTNLPNPISIRNCPKT